MAETWDHIIVGGGTAGCVLASRLSANPAKKVMLIEAGDDTPPSAMPADILDPYPLSYVNPRYRWPLQGHALTAPDSSAAPILHARVMGGGSSIMGMIMLRGLPLDYDGWVNLGAAGWGWDDVLPFFRLLENDLDFAGEEHGKSGPTEIRRHRREDWPDLAKAAGRYAEAHEIPFIADMNTDFRDGYGSLPIAGTRDRRSTSALAYLTDQVRRRPNLRILANVAATGLSWDGNKVTGVHVRAVGQDQTFAAAETIISMGALLSPHFLLREGVGDPERLRDAGVQPRILSRGMGTNLQNHAAVLTLAHLKRRHVQRHPQRNHNNSMFRYSSAVGGGTTSDMGLGVSTRVTWHAIARRLANITPILMAPHSRGRVSLGTTSGAPLVEYNLLGDEIDRARLIEGLQHAAALAASPELRPVIGQLIAASRLANAARFNARTRWNDLRTKAIAALFDIVPTVGERAVRSMGEYDLVALLADDERLNAFVERNVTPLAHHSGTCRMGSPDDPGAVVDAQCRVKGTHGLRVVDASVMPTVPRANTNLPVLMIAEKVAAQILRG